MDKQTIETLIKIKKLQILEKLQHDLQWALKIILNSLYGAVSSNYFIFFNLDMARSITLSGQLFNKFMEKTLNNLTNKMLKNKENKDYVVAMDTDSDYLNISEIVDKIQENNPNLTIDQLVDKINVLCEKFYEPELAVANKNMSEYLNLKQQDIMTLKREVISDRSIFTGKKHYAMRVLDSEGVRYTIPHMKVIGLEIIKAQTPKKVQKLLENALNIIFDQSNDNIRKYYNDCYDKFLTFSVDDIASPISVNNVNKYYDLKTIFKKGTPQNSKAALIHNEYIKKLKITDKINEIKDGDKINLIKLKLPNPTNSDVFAYSGAWSPLFELDEYADYQDQFEKVFGKPFNALINVTPYTLDVVHDISDFI